MQQVIICVGISGSGKSSFATSYISKDKTAIRISRDSLREMIVPRSTKDPQYYKRPDLFQLESIVSVIEDISFEIALKQGRSVVMDNTNLSQKYIAHWLFEAEVNEVSDVKFKLFDCDRSLAKNRVANRDYTPDAVGSMLLDDIKSLDYIDKQAKQYEQVKEWLLKEHKDKII